MVLTPRDAGLWAEIATLRYAGGEHLQAVEAACLQLEAFQRAAPEHQPDFERE